MLVERLKSILQHQCIPSASAYAEAYRVMGHPLPGKFTFIHHPWNRQIQDDQHELVVVKKAAQMGVSEVAINKAFYAIDMLKFDVMYILPADRPHATRFMQSRFMPAMEASPHLNDIFPDIKNTSHLRSGMANMFIRGSKAKAGLVSDPITWLILDEVDKMVVENIPLIRERMSGQRQEDIHEFQLSTPTVRGYGIDKYHADTDKRIYTFKCPHCSKHTHLIYPDCLVITADSHTDPNVKNSYIICKECKHKLDHHSKCEWLADGIWEPTVNNTNSHGYSINQLYSTQLEPYRFATTALRAETDIHAATELYNSKMGEVFEEEGARLSEDDINSCKSDYKLFKSYRGTNLITMGIDVGSKKLDIEICEWFRNPNALPTTNINQQYIPKVIWEGMVAKFEELDALMERYQVGMAVIDSAPERHSSIAFCNRFPGRAKACYYTQSSSSTLKNNELLIAADRTLWLDTALGRFRNKTILLPSDTDPIRYTHPLTQLVRVYEMNRNQEPQAKYIKISTNDHSAHARCYAEIALKCYTSFGGANGTFKR